VTSFLELEAVLGTEFLHPGGRAATAHLMSRLPLADGARALDIGCGTGASARSAAHLGAAVVGVEILLSMLGEAARRQRSRDAPQALLVRADVVAGLPFPNASFDVVWAESVLALVDPARALAECARVLKPAGAFGLNERIWAPGVTAEEAERINTLSRRCFGIPAATDAPLDRDGWVELLHNQRFRVVEVAPVDSVLADRPRIPLRELVARQLRYLSSPPMLIRSIRWRWLVRRHVAAWSRLESWIFVARRSDVP
jgi:SAM-dependent methyltransferase